MKHEPRGLLGNAKCSVQLIRADAFLAVRYGPDCHKPRAILENGANLVRELPLWMLVFALPDAARENETNFSGTACGAAYALPSGVR